jgi:hypothetical protein
MLSQAVHSNNYFIATEELWMHVKIPMTTEGQIQDYIKI